MGAIPSNDEIQPLQINGPVGTSVQPDNLSMTPALDALDTAFQKGLITSSDIMKLASQAQDVAKNQAVSKADIQAAKLRMGTQPQAAQLQSEAIQSARKTLPATTEQEIAAAQAGTAQSNVGRTALVPAQVQANIEASEASQNPNLTKIRSMYSATFGQNAPLPTDHLGAYDYQEMDKQLHNLGILWWKAPPISNPSTPVAPTAASPGTAPTAPTAPATSTTPATPEIQDIQPVTVDEKGNPNPSVVSPINPGPRAEAPEEPTSGGAMYGGPDFYKLQLPGRVKINEGWWASADGERIKKEIAEKGVGYLVNGQDGMPRHFLDVARDVDNSPEQYKGQVASDAEDDYSRAANRMSALNDLRKAVNTPGVVGKEFNKGDWVGENYAAFRNWLGLDGGTDVNGENPNKYSSQTQVNMGISGEKAHWMAAGKNVRNLFEFNALTGQAPRLESNPDVWNKYIDEQQKALLADTGRLRSHLHTSDLPDVALPSGPPAPNAPGSSKATAVLIKNEPGWNALQPGQWGVNSEGIYAQK